MILVFSVFFDVFGGFCCVLGGQAVDQISFFCCQVWLIFVKFDTILVKLSNKKKVDEI